MARRRPTDAATEATKAQLTEPEPRIVSKLLKSGCTLIDLASSSGVRGAFATGTLVHLIGDSNAGKTWLALTTAAEMCRDKKFDDYRIIYDDVENGALMDVEHYFGSQLANRIEPPRTYKDGSPWYSETAEDFYVNIAEAQEDGRPFLWICDSMDSLTTRASLKKFKKDKSAIINKKDTKGSFGDGKAKINSQLLRGVVDGLRPTGSILIIISQTRDNIDPMSFSKKTYSGGTSLKFYAATQIWLAVRGEISKTYRAKKRKLGAICRARVSKSRINGRRYIVEFPLYDACGIDDVGGMIDYLLDESIWKEGGKPQKINATHFQLKESKKKLIEIIEARDLEKELKALVLHTWRDVEAHCTERRKKRYK